ncbi:hypothetical protein Q9295_07220 [Xinfangfangia sp. CPCC 101601]|uniref:Uncharacterized protein n=1 Tax=Pseudogemmobacter lacusdianii TaxID=3069608 RepID=A0ABU0VWL3_9RHOB|nr:hypothetical protein [Xinfangfangia sp. CPCC 101601]MDQ2066156.1 hypothetical protein [Xinfangfangia sp. CPCC 101601]
MQLLLDYAAADPAAWQQDFDARAEMRAAAGLSLLQIWRDEANGAVVCLFELRDRSGAEEWLKVEGELHGAGTARFLKTL